MGIFFAIHRAGFKICPLLFFFFSPLPCLEREGCRGRCKIPLFAESIEREVWEHFQGLKINLSSTNCSFALYDERHKISSEKVSLLRFHSTLYLHNCPLFTSRYLKPLDGIGIVSVSGEEMEHTQTSSLQWPPSSFLPFEKPNQTRKSTGFQS